MKKSLYYQLVIVSFATLMLTMTSCQSQAANNKSVVSANQSANTSVKSSSNQRLLLQQSQRIQRALADENYASITNDIHPIKGVRFSMYAYVQPDIDKVFTREQYTQYLKQDKIRFTWGAMDGTGDILIVPLPEYLKLQFEANKFDAIISTINQFKKRGNTINNIDKIYPNADFVEFYKEGSEYYAGLDWRAMRLVFEEYQGQRYLVAIVSDQWII